MAIFDQARKLLEQFKPKVSSLANIIPPVAGYNAFKQMAQPQFRQQVQQSVQPIKQSVQSFVPKVQQAYNRIPELAKTAVPALRLPEAGKILTRPAGTYGSWDPGSFYAGTVQAKSPQQQIDFAKDIGFTMSGGTKTKGSVKVAEETLPGIRKLQGTENLVKNRLQSQASRLSFGPAPTNTENYLRELSGRQTEAKQIQKMGLGKKLGNFLDDLKAKMVDETAPIEDVLSRAEEKSGFKVLPTKDIRLQIDRVLRSKNLAGQFARENGLESVIKQAPDLNALDQYMIAKQSARVESLGIKTGRDLTRDQQLIQDLGPQYEKMAQQVNQYSRKLLDYSVKAGLISDDLAKELVVRYPEYVPLNRVFSELEKATPRVGSKGVASISKQTVVQKLKGSEREIGSPIESLLLKTQDAFGQGERNVAARQLASYKDLPGFEGLIHEVQPGVSAPYTFSYLENGVKKVFATTKEIEAAAKSLNVEQMGLLGKILSTPTRVLQLGATGLNIPFVVTNMVKDELTGFVNSSRAAKTSLLNPANYVKSLLSALKHDELYDEVVRNAAGGTSFDIAREAPGLAVAKIRAGKNLTSKIAYTVKNPGELLRAIENVVGRGEELGRIKNYRGMKEALLSEGRTLVDSELLAAQAGRENTANFARRGSFGRVLNWVIPFFNAGIQGARQLVRSFANAPAATTSKVALTIFTPVAVSTAWNLSDPERKSIYQDIPQWEKESNIIIIPPNAKQDAKGRWNVIKIPLPPGLSNLGSIVRRSIEGIGGLDPVKFSEIATNLITAGTSVDVSSPNKIASTFTPQIVKPFVEGITNTNLYTGQQIVPSYLKNKTPSEQYKATTPEIAKKIGGVLNVSPLMIENFATSQLGGLGAQLIGKESPVENIQRRFSKASSGAIVDEIYTGAEKYNALNSQIKDLVKSGKQDEARRLLEQNKEVLQQGVVTNKFQNQLSKMYTDRNKVLNSNLPEEQKKQLLVAIQNKITLLNRTYLNFKSQNKKQGLGLVKEVKAAEVPQEEINRRNFEQSQTEGKKAYGDWFEPGYMPSQEQVDKTNGTSGYEFDRFKGKSTRKIWKPEGEAGKLMQEFFLEDITRASIVAFNEAMYNPKAVSPPNKDGSKDYGFWQINENNYKDLKKRYPGFMESKGINSINDLLDIRKNFWVAALVNIDEEKSGIPRWSRWYGWKDQGFNLYPNNVASR
jgi:hypothetical protein